MRLGGCCDCQNTVPVRLATPTELAEMAEEFGNDSVEDFLNEFGKSFEYVCESHDAYGSPCRGGGTTPQGITKES